MPDQVVIKERVPDRVVISEVGPQGIQGPNAIDLLTDTDVAGSVSGDLFGLLVSGKWGSITNVADLLRVDDAADTYVPLAALGSANGVATLDAAGKLSGSQIPALSINDTFVAADEAAMLALVAQRGDVAVRTDLSATFILSGDDPAVLGNWIKLLTPPDAVLSVNGKAGVVQINAPDVPFVSTSDLVSDDVAAAIEEVHADPRLTNSRPPSGAAGGVLAGTYPNPGFAPSPSFTPSSAGAVGLLVIGQTAQTGDYFMAQDSLANTLAQITYLGGFRGARFSSVATGKASLESNYDTGGLAVLTGANANKGLVIRRFSATQTANPQEWQTEAGAAVLRVAPSGALVQNNSTANNLFGSATPAANVLLTLAGNAAANIPLVAKGAASQSVNLQEWQDSTGAAQATVSPAGNFFSSAGFSSSGTFQAGSAVGSYLRMNQDTGGMVVFTRADANKGLVIRRNSATQAGALMEIQDETGAAMSRYYPDGGYASGGSMALSGAGSTPGLLAKFYVNSGINPNVKVEPSSAVAVGVIIKGAASQSADLQQWQNSSGTPLALVSSAGIVRAAVFASTTATKAAITPNGDTGGMLLTTAADANKGLVVRRFSATQSANLQEWQNEDGSALLGYVTSSGAIRSTQQTGSSFGGTNIGGVILAVNSGGAPNVALGVKGAASQSADLLQLLDSTSAVLAKFNSAGRLSIGTTLTTAVLNLGAPSVGVPVMLLKGQSGQTADLVQYDDVNSVTLSKVGAAGGITSYGVTHTFDNLALPSGVAAALSATASTLTVGTPYFYVVTATNAAGETTQSSEVTATPTAPNPSIQVSWSQVNGATGYKVYRSTVSGTYTTPSLVATQTNGVSTVFTDSGNALVAGAPPSTPPATPLTIRGWRSSGGTSDLNVLQIQDYSAATRFAVHDNGRIATGNPATVLGGAMLSIALPGSTIIGAVIQGAASQSVNLQEWRDSTGTAKNTVDQNGYFRGTGLGAIAASKTVLNMNADTGGIQILTQADANKGLVIRRNSGTQSANLLEVQDEAGALKSAIAPSGRVGVLGGFLGDSGGGVASLSVSAPSATAANMVVKAQPAQTANITEWQSSAAGVLARVDSAGNLFASTHYTINQWARIGEANSGGYARFTKHTSQHPTPPAGQGAIYFRDGTTAGTLKLCTIGPGGVEVTIVDNIA